MERFALVGECIKPLEKRSIPRIADWTEEKVKNKVRTLSGMGMFNREEVDMVDVKMRKLEPLQSELMNCTNELDCYVIYGSEG